jgi:hypothetical protein
VWSHAQPDGGSTLPALPPGSYHVRVQPYSSDQGVEPIERDIALANEVCLLTEPPHDIRVFLRERGPSQAGPPTVPS